MFITKLFTFFIFSLAAFSEYMKFVDYKFTTLIYFSDIIPITLYMLIMLLTSRLWFASIKFEKNSRKYRTVQILESLINIVLFSLLIAFAPDVPQYKLLFLLIIITSSLQYGFKHGMTVSAIASVIVWPLICLPCLKR